MTAPSLIPPDLPPPSDARRAAVRLLCELDKERRTLDAVIEELESEGGLKDTRERDLMNALVFGVLRWRARLDHIIGRFSKTPLAKIDPPVLNILRTAVFQLAFMDRIPPSAAVNTAVDIAKSLPTPWVAAFVNAVLRKAAAEYRSVPLPDPTRDPARALAVGGSLPGWLATRWVARHGYDTAAALCAEVNTLPPLTLRANTLKANRDDLARALAPDVLTVAPTGFAPDGLAVEGLQTRIGELEAFRNGWFQVQDEAAQLVSLLLAPRPGEAVLDACAGRGGKTGHLAALMKNQGAITALDHNRARLAQLQGEMRRLGVGIVSVCEADLKAVARGAGKSLRPRAAGRPVLGAGDAAPQPRHQVGGREARPGALPPGSIRAARPGGPADGQRRDTGLRRVLARTRGNRGRRPGIPLPERRLQRRPGQLRPAAGRTGAGGRRGILANRFAAALYGCLLRGAPDAQLIDSFAKDRPMRLIAPSLLAADFARLGEEIRAVEAAGADWIHVDVMDGHFVPNITFGPAVVEAARRVTGLPLDVHLMITDPDRYVADFARAGASLICVHVESCTHLHRSVHLIRDAGVRPGVVLNPATPVEALEWIIADVDFVLVMGVNPGFGGQAFIPGTLEKVRQIRRLIADKGLTTLIEVDGGVSPKTIASIASAGADVFVAGSAIFGSNDYSAAIRSLKEPIAA